MSDGSNNGTSPLSNSARRLLHEFPLPLDQHQSDETAVRDGAAPDHLEALGQEVKNLARELSEDAERQRQLEVQLQVDASVTEHAPAGGTSSIPVPTPGNVAKPNTLARNLVSELSKVTYKEQHEEEFERSLEYVRVQRKILDCLQKHDTILTARAAYTMTRAIVPQGQLPEPMQALRLCYYMRSLGYDTFASIKNVRDPTNRATTAMLRLLVANPASETRGVGYDHLYWMQYIESGAVFSKPYKALSPSRPQLGTRGRLIAHTLDMGPSFTADLINAQLEEVGPEPVSLRGGGTQPLNPLDPAEDAEAWRPAYEAQRSPH